MVKFVLVIGSFGSNHEVLLICLGWSGVPLNVKLDKPLQCTYCWYDFRSPLLYEYLVVPVNIEYDHLAIVSQLLYKNSIILVWTKQLELLDVLKQLIVVANEI